jgi:hypothetical protein
MKEAGSSDHRVLPCGLSAGSRVPQGGSYATWSGKACKTAAERLVTRSLLNMFSRWCARFPRTGQGAWRAACRGDRADRRRRPQRAGRPVRRPAGRALPQRRRRRLLPARRPRRGSNPPPPRRARRRLRRRPSDRWRQLNPADAQSCLVAAERAWNASITLCRWSRIARSAAAGSLAVTAATIASCCGSETAGRPGTRAREN